MHELINIICTPIEVEADAIHDALVEVLRGQLAEIMSVPTPLASRL